MTPEQCLQYAANQRLEVYFTFTLPILVVCAAIVIIWNKWGKPYR